MDLLLLPSEPVNRPLRDDRRFLTSAGSGPAVADPPLPSVVDAPGVLEGKLGGMLERFDRLSESLEGDFFGRGMPEDEGGGVSDGFGVELAVGVEGCELDDFLRLRNDMLAW